MNHATSRIRQFLVVASIFGMVCSGRAADPVSHETAIRFGIGRGSIVVVGKFGGTAAGGGGATSQVNVTEVLKAPPGFVVPDRIAVYWLSTKRPGPAVFGPDPIILFLNAETKSGFTEATGKEYPFVPAKEEYLRLVRSLLKPK